MCGEATINPRLWLPLKLNFNTKSIWWRRITSPPIYMICFIVWPKMFWCLYLNLVFCLMRVTVEEDLRSVKPLTMKCCLSNVKGPMNVTYTQYFGPPIFHSRQMRYHVFFPLIFSERRYVGVNMLYFGDNGEKILRSPKPI